MIIHHLLLLPKSKSILFFIFRGKEQPKCHFFFSTSKHSPDTFPVKEELAYISAWTRRRTNITESRQAKTWSVSTTQRGAVQQSVAFGKHSCRFLVKLIVSLEMFCKKCKIRFDSFGGLYSITLISTTLQLLKEKFHYHCFVSTTMQWYASYIRLDIDSGMTKGLLLRYANRERIWTVHRPLRHTQRLLLQKSHFLKNRTNTQKRVSAFTASFSWKLDNCRAW